MAKHASVFLSSTARDLSAFRDRIRDVLSGLGYLCIRMEDFGARAWEADDYCRTRIEECDIFVGIVGHLYGSSPPGRTQSYTEREYDAAKAKPRLMFVADEDFPLPAWLREPDERWLRQKNFRERVKSEQIVAFFTAPEQLASQVITAIHNLEREQRGGTGPKLPSFPAGPAAAPLTVLAPSREILVDDERFVFLRGGAFPMGSDDGYPSERPQRSVSVPPFFMQTYPVTNRLFRRFADETSYVTTAEIAGTGLCLRDGVWLLTPGADFRHPEGPGSSMAGREEHPVVLVSWYDAKAFCDWFSERTGFDIRLPSEAEWEYAASNGKGSQWAFGDSFVQGMANLQSHGTTTAGSFPPNEFGLYDMTGNVYEWCADTFSVSLMNAAAGEFAGTAAPAGGNLANQFVLRGGSWSDEPKHARCPHRFSADPAASASNWGFRTTLRLSLKLFQALAQAQKWGMSLEEMVQANSKS
jgi:formylglycine-generating enzyme required for sulfatase activity